MAGVAVLRLRLDTGRDLNALDGEQGVFFSNVFSASLSHSPWVGHNLVKIDQVHDSCDDF